jgi:hypothetical protein
MTTRTAVPQTKPAVWRGYKFVPGHLQERDLIQAVNHYRQSEPGAWRIVAYFPARTRVTFNPPPGVTIEYSQRVEPGKMYLETALETGRGRGL